MYNNQLLIGDFSDISGVSKRMLRHYDKLELLSPSFTDDYNGYRYYDRNQLEDINKIKHLQDFGFTLKQIKEIIEGPIIFEDFIVLLKDQEVNLRNEKDNMVHHLLKLQHFISFVENNPDLEGSAQLEEFESERSLPMNLFEVLKNEIKQLPTSSVFDEKIEEVCDKVSFEHITYLSFDVDNFASVNDTYGYDVGDKVIYSVYEVLKKNYKDILTANPNNLLSRLGGDEFALFLVDADLDRVVEITDQTLKDIKNINYEAFNCHKTMTSSCGIARLNSYSHHMEFRHQSIKALLEAKRQGRNQYILLEI